jgi:hypothetical protein
MPILDTTSDQAVFVLNERVSSTALHVSWLKKYKCWNFQVKKKQDPQTIVSITLEIFLFLLGFIETSSQ